MYHFQFKIQFKQIDFLISRKSIKTIYLIWDCLHQSCFWCYLACYVFWNNWKVISNVVKLERFFFGIFSIYNYNMRYNAILFFGRSWKNIILLIKFCVWWEVAWTRSKNKFSLWETCLWAYLISSSFLFDVKLYCYMPYYTKGE